MRKHTVTYSPVGSPHLLAVSVQFQHTFVLLLLENLQEMTLGAALGDLFQSLHLSWAFVIVFSFIPLPSITTSS